MRAAANIYKEKKRRKPAHKIEIRKYENKAGKSSRLKPKCKYCQDNRLLFDFASHEIIIRKPLEFLLNSARTPQPLPVTHAHHTHSHNIDTRNSNNSYSNNIIWATLNNVPLGPRISRAPTTLSRAFSLIIWD